MELRRLKGRRVALGVGGGIAAYKSCDLVRELQRAGAEVRVAMTSAAQRFVTALSFQALSGHAVLTDYFDPQQEGNFGHLDFARWAELYIVAPATADLCAKIRAGLAEDPVTTSLLAFRGPVLLAPAMNVAMFENRATQENLGALLADPRFRTVGPGAGLLACGDVGQGRLAEVPEIVAAAETLLGHGPLAGQRVLITAGPTREHLDPVRFLSNPSSGKMGLAIAEAAVSRGADVTVVLGPTAERRDFAFEVIDVVSAEEMAEAVFACVEAASYFIAAAAVSDWRPREVSPHKRKKGDAAERVELVRTPDVLLEAAKRLAARSPRPTLVGFAAETERLVEHAREKLMKKQLDFIVANDVSQAGVGFGSDDNRVTILSRTGEVQEVSGTKREIAGALWDLILQAADASGSAGKLSRP